MKEHIGEETLALLAGGDLTPEEMQAATVHVARCSSCSAMLENYRSGRRALVIFRDAGVNEDDFTHIRRSVMECLPGKARHPSGIFPWPQLSPLQYGILAAVLLVALTIGIQMSNQTSEPQSSEKVAQKEVPPIKSIPPSPGAGMVPNSAPVAAEASAPPSVAQTRGLNQVRPIATVQPAAGDGVEPKTPPSQATLPDDVVMKLETSDPNVIIIWLASTKGAGR
jgi:hypothetical protein